MSRLTYLSNICFDLIVHLMYLHIYILTYTTRLLLLLLLYYHYYVMHKSPLQKYKNKINKKYK